MIGPQPTAYREFPAQEVRVETGAIAFGDDWPGIFIRGDNAMHYAMHLRTLLEGPDELQCFSKAMLHGLLSDLESCLIVAKPESAVSESGDVR